jgi:hypothetical protein
MRRWIGFAGCAILGLLMLGGGLLVPMHLRAVDASVLKKAGRRTPTLVERAWSLVGEKKVGPATLLSRAAKSQGLAGADKLEVAVTNQPGLKPGLLIWGSTEPRLDTLFRTESKAPTTNWVAFTDFIVPEENRERVLALLRVSTRPLAGELLRTRVLTNTVIFPPAQSSSGQAFDAALSVCGLLLEEGHLSPGLSNAFFSLAYASHASPQGFEQSLLDLMSLGQRLNWAQLVALVEAINDVETLRLQANLVRRAERELPILFSAVQLSGDPAGVARYLVNFNQTGMTDLAASLHYGAGGVKELLKRNQRLEESWVSRRAGHGGAEGAALSWGADLSWRRPWIALTLKWALYLAGGFLLAVALHFGRPAVGTLERPLQVRGFHIAREGLFALGFLLVVLLLSEPFLAQESQKMEFPFRLRLPMVGQAVPAGNTRAHSPIMNQMSLLTVLLFFVLQGLLYTASLVKLAEVRRQRVAPRIKLKLLDNEDHLFDAGLYVGFAGTIISLMLVSVGVIKQPSLMAAYSATSFGIIFVSFFKIFNLRPLRRRLLLEAEEAAAESGVERTLVASS